MSERPRGKRGSPSALTLLRAPSASDGNGGGNDGTSDANSDDGSVRVRVRDLTEQAGQSPQVWRARRATAENALADLVKLVIRETSGEHQPNASRILEDSLRLLTQALVAEGRVTEEQLRKCLTYWLRLEPNRRERVADPSAPADFGPSPADVEPARPVVSLAAYARQKAAPASAASPVSPAYPTSTPASTPASTRGLRPLVEALQMVVGELIAYRIISDDEAVARLCETQLLYLRPAYEQALRARSGVVTAD